MLSKGTPMFRLIVPLAPDSSMLMDRSPPSAPSTQIFDGDSDGTLYPGSTERSSHASSKRQDIWAADESGLLYLLLDEVTIHLLLIFLSSLVNLPSTSCQSSIHFLSIFLPLLLTLPSTSCTPITSAHCVCRVRRYYVKHSSPGEPNTDALYIYCSPSKNSQIVSLSTRFV